MSTWNCRVCGLDYDYSPWGPQGDTPDYGTCECCGAQFGVDDYSVASSRSFRQQWLSGGTAWFYPNLKPADWQLESQLSQIPAHYR
ncbi:hypothetical protein [Hymenobacter chitinivorans]|uniref:Rubredoxin-like domain-containing protein n=1 Tax=Hymenobacter chitinivorans DSM 11115 TaxID=1121954 RepID=A0A2M9BT89_9BACT|nr:hypothetical protein [Hymenobacter chitinivorans]PJJ61151.1 hypothetical protein CLV45_2589 [Hymenobacter chitinivorans DSM 11115]